MSPALRSPLLLLAALLALFSLGRAWHLGRTSAGIDFYQMWVGGQIAGRADVGSLYTPGSDDRLLAEYRWRARDEQASRRERLAAEARRVMSFTASPFLYGAFRLFASGDYERGYHRYRFACLAATAFAVATIDHLLGYPPAAVLLMIVLLTGFFQPFQSDVRVANVNQLQFAMLALFLALLGGDSRRQILAGATLGLAIVFKLNLVLVAPLILAERALAGR